MKKAILISALTAGVLCAQDLSYRIQMAAFTQQNNESRVNAELEKIRSYISNNSNLNAGIEYSGNKKVLFVDVNRASEQEARNILSQVRQIPGYASAYMKPKSGASFSNYSQPASVKRESAYNAPSATTINITDKNQAIPSSISLNSKTSGGLSINEVIRSVLSENPGFKESEFYYFQVGKDLNIAKNAYYPTLDLGGSYGYENRRLDNGTTTSKGGGRISSATLTLTENLYNGGADYNRVNSQSARLDSAAYSVAQKADRLVLETIKAYIDVIKSDKILEIEKLNVRNHENIYVQIKDRAQSGYGVISEEHQAGSRYTLAKSNLVAAENNYKDAIATFEKLYGKKVDPKSLTMPQFSVALPSNEQSISDKAMLCNPSLLVQRANIIMANSTAKEKNAPFLPKVDLVVSGGYDHTDALYDNYEDQKVDTLVKLNYNLFNKGTDKLEKEKSLLVVQQERQTLDRLTRELKESLKLSWQNYTLEQEKMTYLTQHLRYAKATLDAYQDEFRIGRRDLINLLDAESEYNTALKEIINTETALLYSKYRLLDNMGLVTDSFEPGFAKRYIQGACSIQSDLR